MDPPGPPTPPYRLCKRFSLCAHSTPAYASLKKEVKGVVETSPIPVAIFIYLSLEFQPCLTPTEVILRHCETTWDYPRALPRFPNITAVAAILFSTLDPREVILGHSHVYLTLPRQTDTYAILFSLSSATPMFT
jgi:hypothetical protein